jgi:ring-1,2-phenylacetyl-CoA epoxidase subunit PaaD
MVSTMTANVEQIWAWLSEVEDPEIPAISIVDLGIVRNVQIQQGECVVTITPTYSGCPAIHAISEAIGAALHEHGVARVELKTQLFPAWSTDWMSEAGKVKLRNYGIAPPAQQVIDITHITRARRDALTVTCPHCGSCNTRCSSQFGSTPCKALYQCDECLEPFDYFKCH